MALFNIFTAKADGSDNRLIKSHATQQMTHPRLSPDGKWLVYQRYTETDANGIASEDLGFEGTEILICRINGGCDKLLVPAVEGILNCNACWMDRGRKLMYVTTAYGGVGTLRTLDIITRTNAAFDDGSVAVSVSDPHYLNGALVFSGIAGDGMMRIYYRAPGSTTAIQLTDPTYGPGEEPTAPAQPGDYDAKISPDGTTVAFMRRYEGALPWRIFKVVIDTLVETDLSGDALCDSLPVWSNEGTKLIFWHYDVVTFTPMGIWTMNPDGTGRYQIPVPRGYVHGYPAYYPFGYLPGTYFFYTAKEVPGLP